MSGQRLWHHRLWHILDRLAEIKRRIAVKISRGSHHMLNMNAVHTNEPVAEIIERQTELATTIARLKVPGVRTKSQISPRFYGSLRSRPTPHPGPLPFERRGRRRRRPRDFATRQSTGRINPAIRSERGM